VGKKNSSWGIKKTRFKFSPRVDDVFSQEGCSLFYPKMIGHFLPQEGENK